MPKAVLRFYEELNEHLPPEKQKRDFEFKFGGRINVGEMIEAQEVPKGEVDLVLVNGQPVSFDHVLEDGDRVSLYPVFERLDIAGVTRLKGRPLRVSRFVAEKSLRKTAERLNDLGFDVLCLEREEAMEVSRQEKRIFLTARKDVLGSGKITHGICVAAGGVEAQLRQIMESLHLHDDGAGEAADHTSKAGLTG